VLPLLTKWDCREDTLRTLVFAMRDLNKRDEAIEIQKQILEESKIYKAGHEFFYIEDIAEAYEEKEDYANAVKYYEMLDEDVRDEEIYKKLANLYTKLKDYDSAAANYLKAAQLTCRESGWYWRSTGQMLALAGKEDEAKFYIDVALKIDPEDAYAHYYNGVIYQNKGDVYRALHHYNEALKIQPKFAEVYNNLAAISFNEEGDVKGAIQHIETALQQNSDSRLQVSLYISLSTLYKKISDYDKHEYYHAKVMEAMGFLTEMKDDEDDDYEDEDDQ